MFDAEVNSSPYEINKKQKEGTMLAASFNDPLKQINVTLNLILLNMFPVILLVWWNLDMEVGSYMHFMLLPCVLTGRLQTYGEKWNL